MDDPLHATIEEFATEGFSHVECHCSRCRGRDEAQANQLAASLGLTVAQLSARLRCAECGSSLRSVKPWRIQDVLGKPLAVQGHLANLISQSRGVRLHLGVTAAMSKFMEPRSCR